MAEEDLIFGKNKHLFGGIAPSDMSSIQIVAHGNNIALDFKLPDDTIIDDQTVCSIKGVIIRRKATEYPKDEFDGDLVGDFSKSGSFIDTATDSSRAYYYSFFPYSIQGVFNRNPINRIVWNMPPSLTEFSIKKETNTSIQITVGIPAGITGVEIRKSLTGYPVDRTDGEFVTTITTTGETVVNGQSIEDGVCYYYTAFPYNSNGARNYDSIMNGFYIGPFIYGFDINNADSNPDTRVSYPADVDNRDFTAAKMNFDTNTFSYGNWPSTPGEKFMPRPCILNYNGTVAYYLDPNDYTKKIDGTASDITNTGFGGNAMMEWPKIYTKRWEEKGIYHFRCSDVKIDDDYECWCNYDRKNNEIDHFYTPIYNGSKDSSNRLRSLSGYKPAASFAVTDAITYATNNGADWYIEVVSDLFLFQDLLVMMFKSTDLQTALGHGRLSGSATYTSGSMNTKGLFWGSSSNTSGVKAFGMEHRWGNINRFTAGYMYTETSRVIKITRGTKDGSTATNYNTTGAGYLVIDNVPSGINHGYISSMRTESYGRIPIVNGVDGSATTYESDYCYFRNKLYSYLIVGRYTDSTNPLYAGPFYMDMGDISVSSIANNASLSCKPSKT